MISVVVGRPPCQRFGDESGSVKTNQSTQLAGISLVDQVIGLRAWGLIFYGALPANLAFLGALKVKIGSEISPFFLIAGFLPVFLTYMLIRAKYRQWYLTTKFLNLRSAITTVIILGLASSICGSSGIIHGNYSLGIPEGLAWNEWSAVAESFLMAVVSLVVSSTFFMAAITKNIDLPGLPSADFVQLMTQIRRYLRAIKRSDIWRKYVSLDDNVLINLCAKTTQAIDQTAGYMGNRFAKKSFEPIRRDIAELGDALERIRDGEDFPTLANEFSQDPGNRSPTGEVRGGDLGWFGRGQMVRPFEEAVFGAEIGEIVGPVETDFGYHVVWVRDKRMTEDREEILASHILLKVEMGPSTHQTIRNLANQFTFDVEDYGLDEALARNNLSAVKLRPLEKNSSFLTGFGFFAAPARFGFSSQPDDVSDVLESDRSFAIFRLDSILSAGTRPFDEVRSQIDRDLRVEKQMEHARALATQIHDRAAGGSLFEELRTEYKKTKLVGPVTRKLTGSFPDIGRNASVTGALLASEAQDLLPLLEIPGGLTIMFLEDRADFDEDDWDIKKNALKNSLVTERQTVAIAQWLGEIKDRAKIVDNRKYYF